MSNPLKRYRELGIEESLTIPCRYPLACKDLSFILRHAYKKFPKNLQSQIFLDVLLAFRLLPDMERKDTEAAANLLFQTVEAGLPKQKKVQAVTHFKNAKIALKRRSKTRHRYTGSAELPEDVLLHVFGFLDLRSLLHAAQVCCNEEITKTLSTKYSYKGNAYHSCYWVWNSAASDNHIWKKQYDTIFGNAEIRVKLQSKMASRSKKLSLVKDASSDSIDWRESLKSGLTGIPSKFKSHRGYCERCGTIVWLSNLKCAGENFQLGGEQETHQVKPVKISEVVDYVLDGCASLLVLSSSDSDGETSYNDYDCVETGSKLWAYPSYV
ncbi:unnamed protein product [Rhodiola kirilowii]